MLRPRLAFLFLVFLASNKHGFAFTPDQTFSASLGVSHVHNQPNTYGWNLDYRQGLSEHFAWSITKVNEGHIEEHHRDGLGAQMWVRTYLFEKKLCLAAGAGPYCYANTTRAENEDGYENEHGWGGLFSLTASWRLWSAWSLMVRGNTVVSDEIFNSTTLQLGLSCDLGGNHPGGRFECVSQRKNALTAFVGGVIINSFGSETTYATGIEYRRSIFPWLDVTTGGLFEGPSDMVHRSGLTLQGWLRHFFYDGRLSLGFGVGPYFAMDTKRSGASFCVPALLAYSVAYHLEAGPLIRFTWYRVASDYDRDADILLLGLGYAF